jgi:hypothetical protein
LICRIRRRRRKWRRRQLKANNGDGGGLATAALYVVHSDQRSSNVTLTLTRVSISPGAIGVDASCAISIRAIDIGTGGE